jgi:ATP-binding cassette subfamily C protein CydD
MPSTLRFVDVHYAYERGQRPALNGITLEIRRGQTVALVGRTGSGKSTVAHLLLRFIDPTAGVILAGESPLHSLPAAEWRQRVAWVPQQPYLFQGTVAANIGLADPSATQSQIVEAARLAHAHEFIERLPDGYGTLVGQQGARLSGGEAQRIALARAFLKDSPFLILDEATANLDPGTEDSVQQAIVRLLQDRTALIVAHRLGTARRAARILVMDQGRLLEQGTHESLASRNGMYQRLVEAYSTGMVQ